MSGSGGFASEITTRTTIDQQTSTLISSADRGGTRVRRSKTTQAALDSRDEFVLPVWVYLTLRPSTNTLQHHTDILSP